MKVLLVTDTWLPVINGVVTSVSTLREGLIAAGNEVRVLTVNNRKKTFFIQDEIGKVYKLAGLSVDFIYRDAAVAPFMSSKAKNSLYNWQPDIIHTHGEFSTYRFARKIAKSLKVAHIHTYHTMYEDYTKYFSPSERVGKAVVRLGARKIFNALQAVIAPTQKVADVLRSYGVKTKIAVIPTGIKMPADFETRQAIKTRVRQQYQIAQDALLGMVVGRLGYEKHIDEVIRNISKCPQLNLLLVGDGPQRNHIEAIVAEIGLTQRVVFAGAVPHENIIDMYLAGDLFISASTSETQGLTTIEAMGCGLPLLCKEDEAIAGVLFPGVNGYTFQTESDFNDAVKQMADNEQLRLQLGQNGHQIVQDKFSQTAYAKAVEELYVQAIVDNAQ